MDSTLILLRADDEWEAYKQRILTQNSLTDDQMMWGRGPHSYPCMVAGFVMNQEQSPGAQLVCCYVYVEQALQLVKVAGVQATGHAAPHTVNTIGPEQAGFNETILAHVAAMLKVMVGTGITSEEHYSPIFAQELQAIEQQHAEDVREVLTRLKGSLKKEETDVKDSDSPG